MADIAITFTHVLEKKDIEPLIDNIKKIGGIKSISVPWVLIRYMLIFNAKNIPALIPLSLRGVKFNREPPQKIFLRNMLI